jgi:hypothetical protein
MKPNLTYVILLKPDLTWPNLTYLQVICRSALVLVIIIMVLNFAHYNLPITRAVDDRNIFIINLDINVRQRYIYHIRCVDF